MPATKPGPSSSAPRRPLPSGSPGKLMSELGRRGPYRVLRGDLGIVGMRGQVFSPDSGRRLPAIAVGHTWMADSQRYRDLLYHFASWGFVTVAPDANSGFFASDIGLAADLRAALDIVSHVPLGHGAVTVDPDRLGLVGHGFGASAAVLAASDQALRGHRAPELGGVVAAFPAPTTSALLPAAALVRAPGLIIAGAGELDTMDANALPLAQAYGADVVLRTVPRGAPRDLLERRTIKSFVGMNGSDRALHAMIRAAGTGFLLHSVAGEKGFGGFADADGAVGKLSAVDLTDPPVQAVDAVSHLLGAKPRKRRLKKR
ncbi:MULTISPECIES: dienelactone hydrolase family protein [Gordonia]|uniref:Alpha/beta hydrolase n=1 Tax=Gordonia tangerina TaxID=2911060 RepID=A0ABS9DIB6_9ACTN|nr:MULTISPECIES: alpha/beta hydrolase [Gordonia]MCF3938967.1 alpha/beta hydrolase [Gordonia tangerina]